MNIKVKEYIDKQKKPQKEILVKLRNILLNSFPKIKEEFRWGVPVYANGKIYIATVGKKVHIGFSLKNLDKKDIDMLEGSGKTMRHIKIFNQKDIDKKALINLIKITIG